MYNPAPHTSWMALHTFLILVQAATTFIIPIEERPQQRTPFVPQRWEAVEPWPPADIGIKAAAKLPPKVPAKVSPNIKAKLISVHDGDTVTIQISVRLAEIDAPELAQPYGKESRSKLEERLKGGQLLFKLSAVDYYGRAVGYLQVYDSKNKLYQRQVNESMLRAGAVWWYKDYSDDPKLKEVEAVAREARLGLWEAENPEAPWDFRKKKSRSLQRWDGPIDRTVPSPRYKSGAGLKAN